MVVKMVLAVDVRSRSRRYGDSTVCKRLLTAVRFTVHPVSTSIRVTWPAERHSRDGYVSIDFRAVACSQCVVVAYADSRRSCNSQHRTRFTGHMALSGRMLLAARPIILV